MLIAVLLSGHAVGQRVGVVLSGGGAKGLYHVGILKALEENGIPVDYVSGASMGAIVAGMYAAGYSPDEMIQFFVTDTAQHWINQTSSSLGGRYYFKKFEPTPVMISLRLEPKSGESESALRLPSTVLSPYNLDLAFIRMLYPSSAAAGNNFDSLMVPFRCNASDIYNKKSVDFDQGSLSEACRASMAIPLVFQPMKQDSLLLFDGGMYNNFPWQPLDSAFHPDIMIGGICAGNYDNPSIDDIVQQATVMATGLTEYSLRDSMDILIRRRFKEVAVLDYDRAGYIMAKGYEDAMRMMPDIEKKIIRRVPKEEVEAKRAEFRAKIKPLIFESLDIEGLNEKQTRYVYRQLGLNPRQLFDMAYFERNYMQVLSGGVFTGKFPEVTFNPETGFYRMKLTLQTKARMRFSLGGNISSTALNQGYASFVYQSVGNSVGTYGVQGYFGTFYTSGKVGGRHDLYTQFPFYIDYSYTFDNYNYDANHMKRYMKDYHWQYVRRRENFLSASVGIPVLDDAAFRGKMHLGVSEDYYFQDAYTNIDKEDHSTFTYGAISAEVQSRSMNRVLFPTEGKNQLFMVKYTTGTERFKPGTLPGHSLPFKKKNRHWWEARYLHEHYFPTNPWLTIGYMVDMTFSTHPNFDNPLVTAMSAPTFQPIPLMQTMFMPEYRSASYFGAGIIPVFKVANNFSIRTYAYGFMPQEIVYDHGWKGHVWDRMKGRTEFVFGGGLVYQSLIGPASLIVNKYTTGGNAWQLVFNFGYTLFSSRKY